MWNALTLQLSFSSKFMLTLQVISPGATVLLVFRVLSVFLLKCVQRLEGKFNIHKPSKERVRTCKDYITVEEITTVLEIALDNFTCVKIHLNLRFHKG